MNSKLRFFLSETELNKPGASTQTINEIEKDFEFKFPIGYVDFITEFDGCDGEIGDNSWLTLYQSGDLILINQANESLLAKAPNFFLISKDASDGAYAIDKLKGSYHSFGMFSNFDTDPIEFCGNNFEEFIEYLYNQ